MTVTQKQIAQRLNLSQSLVAGVLNGRPGVWASEANRERILRTARELNYRPNRTARALRRGKTQLVACVFFGPPGSDAVIETLADGVAENGYDLLVRVIPRPDQAAERTDDLLAASTCDAVLLWGLEGDVESPAARLERAGVRFAVKGRFEEEHLDWPQVDFDHEGMMAQAVRHLADAGHERIAYLGYDNDLVYARRLRQGYQSAMEARLGRAADPALCAAVANPPEAVAAPLERWMALPPRRRPTAVVIGAGATAWQGIEQWLARNGRRRIGPGPGDLAVAGLGGTDTPLVFGDGLAYRHTDHVELARAMGSRLLAPLLAGEDPATKVVRLLPPLRPQHSLRLPPSVRSVGEKESE